MCVMIKNYVNQKNRQNVSYTINPDHRQIDLYFTRDRRVIIVGTADNNYIFWLSVSACEDEAANGEAFDQITRQKWDTHTALYLVLEEAGFDYEDLESCSQSSREWRGVRRLDIATERTVRTTGNFLHMMSQGFRMFWRRSAGSEKRGDAIFRCYRNICAS